MWILNAIFFVISLNMAHAQLTERSDCDSWGRWTTFPDAFACEAVCETGVANRKRSRDCLATTLSADEGCIFSEVEQESKECSVEVACPAWTTWTTWTSSGSCTALCGSGTVQFTRTRECVGGSKCRGRSVMNRRRRCNGDKAICQKYKCRRRTYRVITEISTEENYYALCQNGSIFVLKCPSRDKLNRIIQILRWQLFFGFRRNRMNRLRLMQDILRAC